MKKTMFVMMHEIRTTLGRKTFTIISFGIPILLGIVAVVLILTNKDKVQQVTSSAASISLPSPNQVVEGYVDEGNHIQFVPEEVPSGWLTRFADEAIAQNALDAGEIEAYYIISPDYPSTGDLFYVKSTFNVIGESASTDTMEWILLANMLGDAELATDLWQPVNTTVTSLATVDAASGEDSWIVEMFPTLMTLMLYMAIIMSSSVLVAAITDEKKNRVMEVLLSSVSTAQMVTGKLLAVAFLGMLLLLAWAGVFLFVALFGGSALSIPADFSLPIDMLVWAGVFGFLGYAMYGALMAGLGALAPDVKDTRSASFVVLAPLIVAYMLMIFVTATPEGPIAVGLSLFPPTSPVSMIGRMAVSDVPIWQSLLAVALQVATAILIVKLVIRLFRAQTLLSGQSFETKRFFGALLGRS
ncbi:MAG: ABC transporter permease [Candidatus Promineifilaceae bacterium]